MKTITYELSIPRLALTKALGTLWRGAYFAPTSPLRLQDLPPTPLPHERFVRVKPLLAGICGTDLHLAFIQGSPFIAPAALPGNARTYMGHEVVGLVAEAGAGVETLAVGDRVALRSGDTCAVLGQQPPCRQCAQGNYSLCEVGEKRGRVESVGAGWSEEIVAHELRFFKVPADIRDEQACLIEPGAVGVRSVLRRMPRAGGAVVLVGVEFDRMHVDLTPVWYQEVDLLGILGHGRETWQGEEIETFALVVQWLREGKLNFDDYISARFPLTQYRQALAYAADKRNKVVKVVLEPQR